MCLNPNTAFDNTPAKYEPVYFKEMEFLRASPSCHLEDMNMRFMHRLDKLRELCNFPLVVNSAYRSRDYELSKKRSGTSWHCKGRAIDIRCDDSWKRYMIVRNAIKLGFNGIGIGKNYIHLDDRDVSPCIWHYYD